MLTVPSSYQTRNAQASRTPVYVLELTLSASPLTIQQFSTAAVYDHSTEILDRNPSGSWRFGEAITSPITTAAADETGNNLTGVYQNAPTLEVTGALSGDSNTAATFNGTDQYMSVPDDPLLDPGDVFSIVGWFKATSISAFSEYVLLDKGTNGYLVSLLTPVSTTKLRFVKSGVAEIVQSTMTLVAGTWYHFAITKDGSTVVLYINGQDVTGTVSNQTIAPTGTDLNFARQADDTHYFPGTLDEFAIFPTALSAGDVQAIYESGVGLYMLSGISDLMLMPRGYTAQVIPERGQAGISEVTCVLQDDDSETVTDLIMSGIEAVPATLKMGFADIALSDFVPRFTGIVDGVRQTQNFTGYELTLRDTKTLTNRKAFNLAKSSVLDSAASGDSTIYIQDATSFDSSGYARIGDEFIQYASKTTGVPPILNDWRDVAYGLGMWVIVSRTNDAGAQIATSEDDGLTWDPQGAPEANEWKSIDFDGVTTFVAVSSDGTNRVMRSTDGKTFVAVSCPSGSYARVRWCPSVSLWVACGTNCLMTSPTGETWTSRTPPSTELWNDIIDCDGGIGKIILISPNGSGADDFAYSTTGTSFTLGSTGVNKVWVRGAWDGTTLVIIPQSDNGGFATNVFLSTTDASAWTSRTASRTDYWYSIVYDSTGGKFVALNRDGNSSSGHTVSADGATWSNGGDTPLDSHWFGLRANAGTIIAVGDGNYLGSRFGGDTMARSTDAGSSWALTRSSLAGVTRGMLESDAVAHSANAAVIEIHYIAPAHPMDILLNVLEATGKGGAGISTDLIDVTGIGTTVKNAIGASYQMTFIIEAEQNLKTWIENEIFQPLHLYPVNQNGRYSVHQAIVPTSSVASITHDDICRQSTQDPRSLPVLTWNENFRESVINYLVYNYDWNPITRAFQRTLVFEDATSIARYGKTPMVINTQGLRHNLAGTLTLINTTGTVIIARHKDGMPRIDTRLFLAKNLLEEGDVIALTSALLPRPANNLASPPVTAGRGLDGALLEILTVGIAFDSGYVDLSMRYPAWKAGV